MIHSRNVVGKPRRAMFDFGLYNPFAKQAAGSRLTDPALGGGALLDIGIYTLTWASMCLNPVEVGGVKAENEQPKVASAMNLFNDAVDEIGTIILSYPKSHAQVICTSSFMCKSPPEFGRIEGDDGIIIVRGGAASKPGSLVIQPRGGEERVFDFPVDGWGFFYEADAVAHDIKQGRTENCTMPLDESLRVMKLMDEARSQNGLVYPQD
jgi:dihydrodiol dehydrogenase / D-xylose 1-dehydrogenase (NADP)